jgi:hypothetical protein
VANEGGVANEVNEVVVKIFSSRQGSSLERSAGSAVSRLMRVVMVNEVNEVNEVVNFCLLLSRTHRSSLVRVQKEREREPVRESKIIKKTCQTLTFACGMCFSLQVLR